MKHLLALLACLCLISTFTFSQSLDEYKEQIDYLCSPKLAGRGYVSKGDQKAGNYLVSVFKKNNLPTGNLIKQPFEMVINTFPKKVELMLDNNDLILGQQFIAHAQSPSGKGVNVKIVRLSGKQLASNYPNPDSVAKAINGGVVAVRKSALDTLYSNPFMLGLLATRAKALMVYNRGNLLSVLSNRQLAIPYFEVSDSLVFFTSSQSTFTVVAKVINHIAFNVIATLPANKPTTDWVIFTAHYDHIGRLGNKVYIPGANDNASGAALLLQLHKLMAKQNNHQANVAFIGFAGEEAGLLGSEFASKNFFVPLENIKLMVNLDLVGTSGNLMVVNGRDYPTLIKGIERLSDSLDLFDKVLTRPNSPNSDHYHFARAGVKAVYFYSTTPGPGYHNISDRPEKLELTHYPKYMTLLPLLTQRKYYSLGK